MRGHFWPFTGVLGGIWRFVTRKVWAYPTGGGGGGLVGVVPPSPHPPFRSFSGDKSRIVGVWAFCFFRCCFFAVMFVFSSRQHHDGLDEPRERGNRQSQFPN